MYESMHDYWSNRPKQRKAPTKMVRKTFDRDALKAVCEMHEDDFATAYDMEWEGVAQRYPDDYYCFLDRGADVLAVAHLDTVVPHEQRLTQFLTTAGGEEIVWSGALDDRLGAYTILEWLPKLGINVDVLLTVGEEKGMSTAQFFDAPEGKDYKWIIEFDRGGTDVVMYQYDDGPTRDLVRKSGAKPADGAFSDIAYLEHLGIKAFNWGIGYQDYHSTRGHAYLEDTFRMVALFRNFWDDNKDTYLPHIVARGSWWGRAGSMWADDDEYDAYFRETTSVSGSVGLNVEDPEADAVVDAAIVEGDILGVSGVDPFPEEGDHDANVIDQALAAFRESERDAEVAPEDAVEDDPGKAIAIMKQLDDSY